MLSMKRMLESKRECPALNIPLLNTCTALAMKASFISMRIELFVKVFFVNYDSIYSAFVK